jgi:oligopeptide/dipeptide ABC transporter ATP-binding protein
MYQGRIVELGPTRELFTNPRHPYTQALLSAVPEPDPDRSPARIELDPAAFDRTAPLRELAEGHYAAI